MRKQLLKVVSLAALVFTSTIVADDAKVCTKDADCNSLNNEQIEYCCASDWSKVNATSTCVPGKKLKDEAGPYEQWLGTLGDSIDSQKYGCNSLKSLPSKDTSKFFYLSLSQNSDTKNYFAKLELGGKNHSLVPSVQSREIIVVSTDCSNCTKSNNYYDVQAQGSSDLVPSIQQTQNIEVENAYHLSKYTSIDGSQSYPNKFFRKSICSAQGTQDTKSESVFTQYKRRATVETKVKVINDIENKENFLLEFDGLLGLSADNTIHTIKETKKNVYNGFMSNLMENNIISHPIFSIHLDKGSENSAIKFGGADMDAGSDFTRLITVDEKKFSVKCTEALFNDADVFGNANTDEINQLVFDPQFEWLHLQQFDFTSLITKIQQQIKRENGQINCDTYRCYFPTECQNAKKYLKDQKLIFSLSADTPTGKWNFTINLEDVLSNVSDKWFGLDGSNEVCALNILRADELYAFPSPDRIVVGRRLIEKYHLIFDQRPAMKFHYPGLGYNVGLRNPGEQLFNFIHISEKNPDYKVGYKTYHPVGATNDEFEKLKSMDQSTFYSKEDTYIHPDSPNPDQGTDVKPTDPKKDDDEEDVEDDDSSLYIISAVIAVLACAIAAGAAFMLIKKKKGDEESPGAYDGINDEDA